MPAPTESDRISNDLAYLDEGWTKEWGTVQSECVIIGGHQILATLYLNSLNASGGVKPMLLFPWGKWGDCHVGQPLLEPSKESVRRE